MLKGRDRRRSPRRTIALIGMVAAVVLGLVAFAEVAGPGRSAPGSAAAPFGASPSAASTVAASIPPVAPGGGVGGPDEAVIVSILTDGRPGTLLVESVGVAGPRREVARLPAFGRLDRETWEPILGITPAASDGGYLAVVMQSVDADRPTQTWLVDLRDLRRPPARIEGGEGGRGWGRDSVLAVLDAESALLRVVDSVAGTARDLAIPPGLDATAFAAADGSGWYAGPRRIGGLWAPTGILARDGTFTAGPLPLPYQGVARVWDAAGALVEAVPDDGSGQRRVSTIGRDGNARIWYRFATPDARAFAGGDVRWTADRTGLWVLDQIPGAYRMVRLTAPGGDPAVVARIPYQGDPGLEVTTGIAGLSIDDTVAVIQRFHEAQPPVTLVDLGSGAIRDLVSPPGATITEFAGWAGRP